MASFTLDINNKKYKVDASPDMPLLWAMRDLLGMTGTKFGCGKGYCGACTVLIDGEAAKSCSRPIEMVGKSKITTVEGLSSDNSHALQRAWMKYDVPQCGYCQSGQLMAAAALLNEKKNPTDMDIDEAMSGVLCRCGTYQRVRLAIHEAAKEMTGGAK
ncbi:MAG: hypothetical protein HY22_04520 [[Candidatus Thermochlorobacteriaceae] bacterium GBChlB]|nr:MAG: hypothetical protein HY22_04520 [[Candidatus Thermochlorobacteriaceae] bacterium GBChlB]